MTLRLRVRRSSEFQGKVERPSRALAPGILAAMARTDDQTGDVLDEAADLSTSPWRLAALADDPDPEVRIVVASNPSASALTRVRLQGDDDPRVRAVASARCEASR